MPAGRSQARVYANVNDKSGRGWWDYGEAIWSSIVIVLVMLADSDCFADNLMVSWG